MNNFLLDFVSFISILSGILVITSKNPVISVLFLISVFVNVAAYLVLLGIGFIGISYLIVYVGAIAVLFLFVIMILNLQLAELSAIGKEYTQNLPLGSIIGSLFLYEIISIIPTNFKDISSFSILNITNLFHNILINYTNSINSIFSPSTHINNLNISGNIQHTFNSIGNYDTIFSTALQIQSIANSIYTYGSIWLIITSIILLVAIVGPITLSSNKLY